MAYAIDILVISLGGIITLFLGLFNWWKFYREADRDYVEQQLTSKYKNIITEEFEDVRKFTETYRISMNSIIKKISLSIVLLTLLGVLMTYLVKTKGSIWRMLYFAMGAITMLVIIMAIFYISNPFDILIIKASPKYLFRRCIWQKLALYQICHSINMLAMLIFIVGTSYTNSQKSNAYQTFDNDLKDDLIYTTGVVFVYFIWRHAVSYYAVSFHSVSQTKRRFEKQFDNAGDQFANEEEPVKSSAQLGELITSVLKTYSDTILSCVLTNFAMNLYHWEYNSYATYYLDKGYYNQIALYASSLVSVNLGAELFKYMTRKQLLQEEDQQHFKHLRSPLAVMYFTSIICYISMN